ncbi:caspase family protein [Dactylosporangium sp. McL0621]|uniref:caspase family protein n=1 Tax=Dactylosporangium sp. McL0621 TaxID=3415678 RepID=UPI003CFB5206
MTAIVGDAGPGPRLHAFVVGVGTYPHCDDPPRDGPASRLLGDIGSLTSPPRSATAVAEWLLSTPRGDGDPPLGSVEVLISAAADAQVRGADGACTAAGPATFDEFKAAFRRWLDRCDTDPGNIALFYFCGHGWDRDGQLLLLHDVGADPGAVLENCVELSEIRRVMQHCRARTQVYLIDACREMPDGFAELDTRTRPLMDRPTRVPLPLLPLDAPVYFSTAQHFAVEVEHGMVTPFTSAVLRTLDGLGAHNEAGRWTVATDRFGAHLRGVITWDSPEAGRSAGLAVSGEQSGASVLRTLDGPPRVPFRLTCSPSDALAAAAVTLVQLWGAPALPVAVVCDGRGEAVAGVYQLHLGFPAGVFREESVCEAVLPPNKTWYTRVLPA